MQSERQLLAQLAPEMDEDLIRRLVAAFQDLRRGYDEGKLLYPYSLRGDGSAAFSSLVTRVIDDHRIFFFFFFRAELINLVRHMRAYQDSLETSLRNVFDFDVYKPETMEVLYEILEHHG